MSIDFRDKEGKFIKSWPNVEYPGHGIPGIGDHVLLHWGDYNEEVDEYVVLWRVYDGTRLDRVVLVVSRV